MEERLAAVRRWHQIYWDEFIPFAHGVRRLAVYYNDAVLGRGLQKWPILPTSRIGAAVSAVDRLAWPGHVLVSAAWRMSQ